MKKIGFLLLFIWTINIYADSYDPGTHYVAKSVQITNANSYSELDILACINVLVGDPEKVVYKIQENEHIELGYKFNTLRLLGIWKELYDEVGSIDETSLTYVESDLATKLVTLAEEQNAPIVYTAGYYVDDAYPMKTDSLYYTITEVHDTNVTLKLTKRIITFNDDTPDKTITY